MKKYDNIKIVNLSITPCPICGSKSFRYHVPEERQSYKGSIVVGKYECIGCGAQFGK